MILYSIVPLEVVFQGFDSAEGVTYFEARYKGERVIIAQLPDRHYEISRLLSTRPATYLNADFKPGNAVGKWELS